MQSPTGGGPGPGASRACGVCGEEAAPHGWLHCCQGVGAPQQPLEAAGVAGERDEGEVSELELEDSDAEEAMEVLEDDGEEEVGEVEAAYTKVLGEEDTGDQAAPSPPPTPPSTTPALSPSPLAVKDDIATAAVVDTLLGVVTHKMAVEHRAPSTSEARTMRQMVKRFEMHGDIEMAWAELRRCRWVEVAARGLVQEELKEQVAMYLEIMRRDSGVKIVRCNRYSKDTGGAKVVATRGWRKGEMVDCMVAATYDMTEEEDAEVVRQGKAFSLGQHGRRGGRKQWLGPLAYINHSCRPNCKYVVVGDSEVVQVMVERNIRAGDELTCYYAPDYFGKNNYRCECQACEAQCRGAFTVRDYRGRVTKVQPRVVEEVQGRRRRLVTKA